VFCDLVRFVAWTGLRSSEVAGLQVGDVDLKRNVVASLSSFLSVARIVAHTELIVIVPSILGKVLATQEPVKLLEPPFELPAYAVKQHWHERFHADAGNAWLRLTLAELFVGGG